jgi:hypothetical protein
VSSEVDLNRIRTVLNTLLTHYDKTLTVNKWEPASGWFLLVRGWPARSGRFYDHWFFVRFFRHKKTAQNHKCFNMFQKKLIGQFCLNFVWTLSERKKPVFPLISKTLSICRSVGVSESSVKKMYEILRKKLDTFL